MCEGDGTDPKQGDEGDLGVGGGGEDENAVQKQGEYRHKHTLHFRVPFKIVLVRKI